MALAILATGLVKRYGDVRAVDGLDLAVPAGTVLGLLGPNGAGKSTTVRILATLVRPDGGHCEVAGIDVLRHPDRVRRSIGLAGQYASVDEDLTGRENLEMVGRLHRLGRTGARARTAELLDRFGLSDAAHRQAKTYSGGMRRRLDLAAALIAVPPVVFLDEPTTGLDPEGRLGMWEVIRGLVRDGTTVLLTTQYLEEADQLSSAVAVIDRGRVVAQGTAAQLKATLGGERLRVTLADHQDLVLMVPQLAGFGGGEPVVDQAARTVTVGVPDGVAALVEAVRRLDRAGVRPVDLAVHRPTLDDVFLQLTGRPGGPEQPAPAPPDAPAPGGRHAAGRAGATGPEQRAGRPA